MINVFEVFYNSGGSFEDCLNKGPGAIKDALSGCSASEINSLARELAVYSKKVKGLDPDQMISEIIARVVDIASRGMEFGDY